MMIEISTWRQLVGSQDESFANELLRELLVEIVAHFGAIAFEHSQHVVEVAFCESLSHIELHREYYLWTLVLGRIAHYDVVLLEVEVDTTEDISESLKEVSLARAWRATDPH